MRFGFVRLVHVFAVFVCFSCSVSLNIQAQQPAPDKNAGSISGRVTVDGKPKAGLMVELLSTDTNGRRRVITKATTNKTGRYLFTGIAPGTYDVSPSAPTLVVPNEGKSGQSGKTIAIETGERIKGIDFDLVTMGSIRGRVRNASGEPVKGQVVVLLLRGEGDYSRSFSSNAEGDHITNDEGNYRISGVPPGRYVVKVGTDYGVTADGRSPKGAIYYPETFHPDTDDPSKATIVEIATGQETADVDITIGSPLKLYEIVGQTIADKTGVPVPNVGLEIITTSKNGMRSTHSSGGLGSNADGEFRIKNAMPGRYVIAPENNRASNTYGDSISFEVRDADVTGLMIPMHSASTLTGMVLVEGEVSPPMTDILSKLTVSARTSSDNLMSSTMSSRIGPDGGFRITGIRPGKVNLSYYMERGGPEGIRLVRIERNGVDARNGIDVGVGEDVTGLRLVVAAGSSVLKGEERLKEDRSRA